MTALCSLHKSAHVATLEIIGIIQPRKLLLRNRLPQNMTKRIPSPLDLILQEILRPLLQDGSNVLVMLHESLLAILWEISSREKIK